MHNAVSILTPKRDRLSLHSFSIRDLFLVTMIVALGAGWWVDRSKLAFQIERLEAQEKYGTAEFLRKLLAPAPNPPKP